MEAVVMGSRRARLKSDFDKLGFKNFCTQYGLAALNKLTVCKVFVLMTLTPQSVDTDYYRLPDDFEGRFLSEDEIREASRDTTLDLPAEFVEQALKKGDRCFGIFDRRSPQKRLASYGWYSSKPTILYGPLQMEFDPNYFYMYRGYTADAYRGKRLHAFGMALAMRALLEESYASGRPRRGLLSYVEMQNFSSLKSVFRFGYQAVGKLRLLQVPSMGKPCFVTCKDSACATFKVALRVAEGARARVISLK